MQSERQRSSGRKRSISEARRVKDLSPEEGEVCMSPQAPTDLRDKLPSTETFGSTPSGMPYQGDSSFYYGNGRLPPLPAEPPPHILTADSIVRDSSFPEKVSQLASMCQVIISLGSMDNGTVSHSFQYGTAHLLLGLSLSSMIIYSMGQRQTASCPEPS